MTAKQGQQAMIKQQWHKMHMGQVTAPEWIEEHRNKLYDNKVDWRGQRTYYASRAMQADVNRRWVHFDAEGKNVADLTRMIAGVLMGMGSTMYSDQSDLGHFVIVTNCDKVQVAGKGYHYKLYFRNLNNRPGNTRVERFKDLQKRFPERVIMKEVWRKMRTNKRNRRIFRERLKLYTGPNHLHYDKDVYDFPMHKIKSVIPGYAHPYELSQVYKYKVELPRQARIKEAQQANNNDMKLKAYKKFLAEYAEREEDDDLQKMEMSDLYEKAETIRRKQVFEENKGVVIAKPPPKYYPGTIIEVKPIRGNLGPGRGIHKR